MKIAKPQSTPLGVNWSAGHMTFTMVSVNPPSPALKHWYPPGAGMAAGVLAALAAVATSAAPAPAASPSREDKGAAPATLMARRRKSGPWAPAPAGAAPAAGAGPSREDKGAAPATLMARRRKCRRGGG